MLLHAITAYLVAAMLAWAPAKDHAPDSPEVTVERYNEIAADIASVALEEDEHPVFRGEDTLARAHTALQLASLAFWESHYWRLVDDGRCNDRAWRRIHAPRGSPMEPLCDGSLAVGLWQAHTSYGLDNKLNGLLIVGDSWQHGPGGYVEKDLLADRQLEARVALHMLRRSMRGGHGSLCGYTGEPAISGCPKAKVRKAHVAAYWKANPFEAP